MRADAGQGTLFPLAYRVQRGEATAIDVLSGLLSVTNAYGAAKLLRFILASTDDWYAWPLLKYCCTIRVAPCWSKRTRSRCRGSVSTAGRQSSRSSTSCRRHQLSRTGKNDSTALRLKKWTNDLGNVCLTYDNSSYRTGASPNKKGSYSQERMCYANPRVSRKGSLRVHGLDAGDIVSGGESSLVHLDSMGIEAVSVRAKSERRRDAPVRRKSTAPRRKDSSR